MKNHLSTCFCTINLTYRRKVAKILDEEKRIVVLDLNKNHYCSLKKLHLYKGPPHCDKICRSCFFTYSAHNEVPNHP